MGNRMMPHTYNLPEESVRITCLPLTERDARPDEERVYKPGYDIMPLLSVRSDASIRQGEVEKIRDFARRHGKAGYDGGASVQTFFMRIPGTAWPVKASLMEF